MRAASLFLFCAAVLFAESIAGLKWTPPVGWKSAGSTSMRAATYPVAEGAECVVYFFGEGQGGTVQANMDRWQGQFTTGGKPSVAKIGKAAVHGLPVTSIDVSGEYSGMGGPTGSAAAVTGYRLLGAIIEGPGGNIFIKFTGPAKVVAANQAKFQQLLDSFDKAGK
jgi:hypothetical protein